MLLCHFLHRQFLNLFQMWDNGLYKCALKLLEDQGGKNINIIRSAFNDTAQKQTRILRNQKIEKIFGKYTFN